MLAVLLLSGVLAIWLNSTAAVIVFLAAAVIYGVVAAVNAINSVDEISKRVLALEEETKQLGKDVSSVNSKLNLAIPDAKRYGR